MDFPQFRDIHHLIPQVLDLRSLHLTPKRDWHQIEDSDQWEIYVGYREIVSQFLIDQIGSPVYQHPPYCVRGSSPLYTFVNCYRWSRGGQEHYVSLAKYLLSFLLEGPW